MGWFADRRRTKLLSQPVPSGWDDILVTNVAAYSLVSEPERNKLLDLTRVFVDESTFEGCGGLEMDDEVKVTIAGSAALMALHRDIDLFGRLGSIYVYPSAVVSKRADVAIYTSATPIEDGLAIDGQAHQKGPIVLAWDAVVHGAADPYDGRNVVIHELAHKLDFRDGAANGTPLLPNKRARAAWKAAFEPAFKTQRARASWGVPSLLRDYATLDAAEYFAVASEMYFERPDLLRSELPDVTAQLANYYG